MIDLNLLSQELTGQGIQHVVVSAQDSKAELHVAVHKLIRQNRVSDAWVFDFMPGVGYITIRAENSETMDSVNMKTEAESEVRGFKVTLSVNRKPRVLKSEADSLYEAAIKSLPAMFAAIKEMQ